MLNICLVEDNKKLGDMIHQELLVAGYQCDWYTSVEDVDLMHSERYHIFLLDIMLPGEDGVVFTQRLREHSNVGIILLTAKSTLRDKEEGFVAGADDYITKPFKIKELTMRINALADRLEQTHFYKYNDIFIDWKNRTVKKGTEAVHLTPTEWEVVGCLVRNKGMVCQRVDIIEHVRGADELFTMSRSLDVAVATIRKKIGKDAIETVQGVGYKLASNKRN